MLVTRVDLLDTCCIVKKLAALVLLVVGLIAAYAWSSRSTEDPGERVAGDALSVTTEIARVRLDADTLEGHRVAALR